MCPYIVVRQMKKHLQLIAPSGQSYFLDRVDKALKSEIKRNPTAIYDKKVNLFFRRNSQDPISLVSELRGWFGGIKQPTRQQVKSALVLTVDEDYSLKAGGGAISDNLFSSSLKWLQAHPVTGLDYEPVIIKKHSANFEDVLITFDDIMFLISQTLTVAQVRTNEVEDIDGRLCMVVRGLTVGTIPMSAANNTRTKLYPFTPEYQQILLSRIDNPAKVQTALGLIGQHKARLHQHLDWITQEGNEILGADNQLCPQRTAIHSHEYRTKLIVWNTVSALLSPPLVLTKPILGPQLTLFQ